MKEFIIFSDGPDKTQELGYRLGRVLKKDDVILLDGDLGAGKTCLTQGIAKAIGINEPTSSPTYNLVNEYLEGETPLYHYDVYRLGSAEELLDIGFEDNLGEGIIVVEWAVNTEGCFPENAIRIYIERLDAEGAERRKITLKIDEERGEMIVNSLG